MWRAGGAGDQPRVQSAWTHMRSGPTAISSSWAVGTALGECSRGPWRIWFPGLLRAPLPGTAGVGRRESCLRPCLLCDTAPTASTSSSESGALGLCCLNLSEVLLRALLIRPVGFCPLRAVTSDPESSGRFWLGLREQGRAKGPRAPVLFLSGGQAFKALLQRPASPWPVPGAQCLTDG